MDFVGVWGSWQREIRYYFLHRWIKTLFTYHYKELIVHWNNNQIFKGILSLSLYIFIDLLHYILTFGEPVWECRMQPSPFPATPSRTLIPLGTSDIWFCSYFCLRLKRIMSSWIHITIGPESKIMLRNDKLCTAFAQICQLSTCDNNFTTRRL